MVRKIIIILWTKEEHGLNKFRVWNSVIKEAVYIVNTEL